MKILLAYYNYPQLSATYTEAEIQFFQRQGLEVQVWSETTPGAAYTPSCKVHRGSLQEAERAFNPDIVHFYWIKMAEKYIDDTTCPIVTARSHSFESEGSLAAKMVAHERVKTLFVFPHQLAQARANGRKKIVSLPVAFSSRKFPLLEEPTGKRQSVVAATAGLPAKDLGVFFDIARLLPDLSFTMALATCEGHEQLPAQIHKINESLAAGVDLRVDVPHADIPFLLSKSGIYLCTQTPRKRGMPIAIAEALASGCFVLVPRYPWLCDMVGIHGIGYSDAEDAASTIRHIQSWTEDRWKQATAGASSFAHLRYSDESVLVSAIETWRSLVAHS